MPPNPPSHAFGALLGVAWWTVLTAAEPGLMPASYASAAIARRPPHIYAFKLGMYALKLTRANEQTGARSPGLHVYASPRLGRTSSHAALRAVVGAETLGRQGRDSASGECEARQPCWSRIRRALASIRFSPADRP